MKNSTIVRTGNSSVSSKGYGARSTAKSAAGTWRALAAALALLLTATSARAQSIVQEYYVPLPETQVRASFLTLAPATGATMDSVISIVVAVSGTKVVYDQWEDGYEIDINNPVQASTKIWGDGNDANGIAPGFVHDPASFNYGTVLTLRNLVPLPRNAANILYDGRDRVGATRGIVMSRAAWATSPGPLLSTAVNIQSTIDWGTNFVMPIGQDVIFPTPLTASMFEYTSMLVMAELNNTVVQIDTDGNGTVDVTTTINQGESYQVAGGVNHGATVTSTKPVQVQLLTGDIGGNYESRSFTIPSTDQWSPQYYSPVGTATDGEAAYIFLYNPGVAANTINYLTRTGSGSFSIPAKSTYTFLAPQNSGTRFTSATAQDFFAVGTAGASPTQNNVHDWGFALVPAESLTTEAVVGWGPGSSDGTQNGNPVWVTPVAPTTIYVDYNGDRAGALTDPAGGKYDLALTVAALEVSRVYEPDRDQTGMRLYTLDGTLITAAWGQDPAVAGPGLPYLDMGTTIPNFPVPTLYKTSSLYTDVAPVGLSVGDTIQYTITLNNQGLVAIGNAVVLDPLPSALSYVAGSTTHDGSPIPDSGVTPFPLDESGYTVPIIPRRGSTSFTFRAVVITAGAIINTANSSTGATSTNVTAIPPAAGSTQCVIDFTNSSGTTIASTSVGASLYVTVTDADANTNTGTSQSFTVVVTDTTSADVETITLTETGVNTGVFRNTSGLATSSTLGLAPNDGTLHLIVGDTISVSYVDPSYGDTCNDSTGVAAASKTKVLYLSADGSGSPDQDLDRIDPVATSDATTSITSSLAAPSGGSVSISGAATSGTATNTTLITFSHSTGSGANRLLLVGVSMECNGANCTTTEDPSIGTVTFNGTSLTRLGVSFANTRDAIVEIWYMFNPPASTTANVVVTQAAPTTAMDMVGGAVTFGGVDTAQTLSIVTATGNSVAPSVTIPSATGRLVFDVISLDSPGTLSALTAPRTLLWNQSLTTGTGNRQIQGAASYNNGAASVTETWATTVTTNWAAAGVSISPGVSGAGGSATFTQTPTLCEALTLPVGSVVSAQTYFTTGGSMPASPSITAVLRYGATTIATSSAVASDGTKLTFTFPALGSTVTVPSGSALELVVTNGGAVAFQIQYDSTTKPSFVSIPTSTVIHVDSVRTYDAAYSGGTITSTGFNGQPLYVRTVVGDPFGAYDITSLPLSIDGPGVTDDISTTLTAANVVNTTTCAKTYEYVWSTGSTQGNYDIAATAKEGFENTVTDSKSTSVSLSQLDLGTPCTNAFTTGLNGVDAVTYAANEQVCVRVTDLDQNTNVAVAETLTATVVSGSGDSELLTLTETGVNTGTFAACLPASSSVIGTSNNGSLYAPLGSTLTGSYTDPNDASDVCGDTSAVPAGSPGISVTKTLLTPVDGQAKTGESAQFRIRVANTGNTTLATVAVTDTFPAANLTYVSASPSPSSTGAGTLTWSNIGPMASGATVDLLVNYTALASANPAVNSATANAGGGVTATGSANLLITNPGILVTKTLVSPSPGPATKGNNVVYSITVRNTGDTSIDSLPLQDTYSGACFTFVSSTPVADGTGYGSILWTDVTGAGSLAPSATATISVTLQAAGACNPASNTATADFVTDTNGDSVSASSSSATIVTQAGSISGFVYEDQGAAGFGGDVPLQDVTVTLHTDPNGDGDPSDGVIVQVLTTLTAGNYEFANLPLGNYVVVETDPIGYNSIADTQGSNTDNRIAVVVATAAAFTNNNFLDDIINPADYSGITGQVRFDSDVDGNFADPDPGIDGVIIDLYTDPNGDHDRSDGVLFVTTTTAGGGLFAFNGIPPGNYVINEHDPVGYNYSTADTYGVSDDLIAVYAPPAGTSHDNVFLDTNVAAADISVSKTGPAAITPGTNVIYTITVANSVHSDASATAVSLADPTPTGLTFVSNTGDCVTAYPCSLGTITAGATRTISSTYSVPSAYTTPTTVLNTATVTATTLDPVPGDNSSTTSTPVTVSADVSVSKAGPASITPGANAVYTITVTNNGSSDAASVIVADPTPTGLTFISNAGNCATAYPCSLGTLTAGATRTITTTYSVPASYSTPNPVLNTATVSTTTSDPTPGNNTSTSSIAVAASADVSISKAGPASITPGANAVYTITVTNNGSSDAAAVAVADTTPTGFTFVSNAGDCVSTYPCSLGTLAAGATRTITTTYSVPASYTTPDPVLNTVTVSTTTDDPTPGNNTSTSSTPLAMSADVAISKTGPVSITPGTNAVYTISVTNSGLSDAAAVAVADPTPVGLTFVSNAGDCVGAYPCSLGTVAAGATRTITTTYSVPASYTTPNPVLNTATVSTTTNDPTAPDNTATSSTPVNASADVSISKAGPASITPGANAVYTITVTNNGSSDAASVSVADSTPSGLTFVSNAGDCVSTYPCSLGTMAAGATRTVTSTYSVPASYTTPDPVLNTATVSTTTDDPTPGNDTSTSSAPVTASADVSISKTGPASITPGADAIYTITVVNNGSSDAAAVSVADLTPTGFTFVSNTGACVSAYPCDLGVVHSGTTRTITSTYLVPASYTTPDPVVNTATVSSSTNDPTPGNGTSTTSTPVIPSSDLQVSKTGPVSITPGTNAVYTIAVTNNGASDAAAVSVADPTPTGLTFVSNAGDCVSAYPCSLGIVAAGATRTITSTYSVPASYTTPDPVLNTATVTSTTADPTPPNNTSTSSTPVVASADVAISKTGPVSVTPGTNAVYTITVTNNGASDAAAVSVADPTPTGLTFVSNTGNCVSAYPCSLGIVAAGATRTITSTYSVPASYTTPAPLVNTATVSSTTSDSTPANNTSTATAAVVPSADLSIVKNGPATFTTGSNVVYTITVTNAGPSDAAGVAVADPTPSGLVFVSNSGSCASTYPCSLATVAAGATATITTTYSVPSSYSGPNPLVNNASISSTTTDPDASDNSDGASASAVAKVTGVVFDDLNSDGLQNPGEPALGGVTVTLTGPSCPAGCTATTNGDGNYAFTGLTFGAYTVVETDQPDHTSTTPNSVSITAGLSATTVNFGDLGSSLHTNADLSINKNHSGIFETCAAGIYTLSVDNLGPDSTSGTITVADTLPAGLSYVSAGGTGWTCSAVGQIVTCTSAGVISATSRSSIITLTVNIEEGAYPTVNNTASVSSTGDSRPVNDTASDSATVRVGAACQPAPDDCAVSLKKVHSGNTNAGGEVLYTLQWSNSCRNDLGTATIVDPLPAGLELLGATSPDATATIAGNTATFSVPAFTAMAVGKGLITARIDPALAIGTSIANLATLSDAEGHSAQARNSFRVRGGSTDTARLSCFLRAQYNTHPGSYVSYTLRYKNGSENNELSLTIPDEVRVDSVYPTPDSQDGNTLYWSSLARTAGKVTVTTFVDLATQDQTLITSSATMDDRAGGVAVCEYTSLVTSRGRLFTSIKAPSHVRAGMALRYTARYRSAVGSNQLTVSLPDEVRVVKASPAPNGGTDKTLIWSDLPVPSGLVKIDTVANDVPDGTVLVGSVSMTDQSSDVVGDETRTVVSLGNAVGNDVLSLNLDALRSMTAGTTADISIRYDGMKQPGTVGIELPPELTPVLEIPAAEVSGNTVVWTGLTSKSGSLRLRVAVDAKAASGATLVINGSAIDAGAVVTTAQATTVIRSTSPSPVELSMALTLGRTVTKGTTADIAASYDGMQGTGLLTMTLPTGLVLQSTVPAGATTVGNNIVWNGLGDSSGTVRARVRVSVNLVSGRALSVSGTVSDGSGMTASAAETTTVR